MNVEDAPDPMTSAHLAAVTHANPATVRGWRHVGAGPRWFRPPHTRRVLYRRADVLAWLESGSAGGADVAADQPAAASV